MTPWPRARGLIHDTIPSRLAATARVRGARGRPKSVRERSTEPPCAATILRKRSRAPPPSSAWAARRRPSSRLSNTLPDSPISATSSTLSSRRSPGPPPERHSTASRTSSAFPTVLPSGRSIAERTAVTANPRAVPTSTMARASSRDSSMRVRNAPWPTFTSSTSPSSPSASFFDMIDAVIKGNDGTVAVTSRSA